MLKVQGWGEGIRQFCSVKRLNIKWTNFFLLRRLNKVYMRGGTEINESNRQVLDCRRAIEQVNEQTRIQKKRYNKLKKLNEKRKRIKLTASQTDRKLQLVYGKVFFSFVCILHSHAHSRLILNSLIFIVAVHRLMQIVLFLCKRLVKLKLWVTVTKN